MNEFPRDQAIETILWKQPPTTSPVSDPNLHAALAEFLKRLSNPDIKSIRKLGPLVMVLPDSVDFFSAGWPVGSRRPWIRIGGSNFVWRTMTTQKQRVGLIAHAMGHLMAGHCRRKTENGVPFTENQNCIANQIACRMGFGPEVDLVFAR
jgi:hypothetical protein